MKQLTASDFKNKGRKKVKFEELDGYVFIKKLSVKDSASFQDKDITNMQRGNEMIALSVVDEEGNKIFNSTDDLQDTALDNFQKLSDAIMDYNGLSLNKTDEIEKN